MSPLVEVASIGDRMSKRIYWHRELPPLNAELLGEHVLEATSGPDLFGAVVCGVPVTDMLRYHRFTAGRHWVPEYGNGEAHPDRAGANARIRSGDTAR